MRAYVESAFRLSSVVRGRIRKLAEAIHDKELLPVIGAGLSMPCSQPGATSLARDLLGSIRSGNLKVRPRPVDLNHDRWDLGRLADVACLEHDVNDVLRELGFDDNARWPSSDQIPPHDCAYRVLARMARESLISESITFNYDSHHEFGLQEERFRRNQTSSSLSPRLWPNRFDVVADATTHARLEKRGEFQLTKAHGSVERWREDTAGSRGDNIVIRWSQLLDWREDNWSRDLLADRARRHVLLVIGFGANDPVIHASIARVMKEVWQDSEPTSPARIRVIDPKPNTTSLRMLIKAGNGEAVPDPRVPAAITCPSEGAGPVLLCLLAELLACRLKEEGGSPDLIPALWKERFPLLAVSAPAMQHWTWRLLKALRPTDLGLGTDLENPGYYVPLRLEPGRTMRSMRVRSSLMQAIGGQQDFRDDGWVRHPDGSRYYMPTGLTEDEVRSIPSTAIRDAAQQLGARDARRMIVFSDQNDALAALSAFSGDRVAL